MVVFEGKHKVLRHTYHTILCCSLCHVGKTNLIKISLYGKEISNPDQLELMKSFIFIGKPHDGLLVKAISV